MNAISRFARRRPIKAYRTRLPRALAKDYGRSTTYFPAQVISTIARHKLSASHLVYALALCCTPEAFAAYCAEQGIDAEYDELRDLVGNVMVQFDPGRAKADLSVSGPAGESGVGGAGD